MKTVSFELSDKLNKAGFPQNETEFDWYYDIEDKSYYITNDPDEYAGVDQLQCAAPLADEILDLLPEGLFVRKKGDKWYGCRYHDDIKMLSVFTKADSMADAAAKLYLDWKESNNIELSK